MIIHQLSLCLENKSGRLTEVPEAPGKEKIRITAFSGKLQDSIASPTVPAIKVTLVEPEAIERSEGKYKCVIDKRRF